MSMNRQDAKNAKQAKSRYGLVRGAHLAFLGVLCALAVNSSGSQTPLWPAADHATGYAVWTNCDGQCMTGTVKDARAQWCYDALAERAAAAGVPEMTNDFKPRWYLWEHANVVAFKAAVSNLANGFLNLRMARDGNFDACLTNANGVSDFPFLNATSMTGSLVASNFFTVTPWQQLERGSNGWDALREAITNLQATVHMSTAFFAEWRAETTEGTMATNAVQAKNVAASNYTYRAESQIETNVESMGFFSYTAIVGEPVFFENYNAAIYNTRALLGVTNVATNVSFRCDTYIFPIALSNSWTIWASDNPSENTFDANGHFSGNTPHRIDAFSGVGSNGWFQAAAWYGGSAPLSSSLPAWADVPPWDGTNENKRARGCKADFGAVLWWQFKNK